MTSYQPFFGNSEHVVSPADANEAASLFVEAGLELVRAHYDVAQRAFCAGCIALERALDTMPLGPVELTYERQGLIPHAAAREVQVMLSEAAAALRANRAQKASELVEDAASLLSVLYEEPESG